MNIAKIILISLILVTSCESKLDNKLTETIDEKITWSELDEFPSVKECNSLNDSNLIRECFESFLSNHLLEKIDLSNVIIKNPINDTVTISLLINNSGKVTISKKNIPETVFLLAIEKLQPHVKSIFYGEACSSVPLFKKKND